MLLEIPERKGKVGVLLNSDMKNDTVIYQVQTYGNVVPLYNLRLSIILPEGTKLCRSKAASVNDKPVSDPDLIDNVLTYRLGNTQGDWSQDLHLKVTVNTNKTSREFLGKALLTFDTQTNKNQRTPIAEKYFEI